MCLQILSISMVQLCSIGCIYKKKLFALKHFIAGVYRVVLPPSVMEFLLIKIQITIHLFSTYIITWALHFEVEEELGHGLIQLREKLHQQEVQDIFHKKEFLMKLSHWVGLFTTSSSFSVCWTFSSTAATYTVLSFLIES